MALSSALAVKALPALIRRKKHPRSVMHEVHETVGWIFAALVTAHVAAALRHLARRDGVFARIWVFR